MKLDIAAPDPFLVERYLEEIARAYDVKWKSHILVHEESEEEEDDDDDDDTMGGQAEVNAHRKIVSGITNFKKKIIVITST